MPAALRPVTFPTAAIVLTDPAIDVIPLSKIANHAIVLITKV